MLFVLYVEQYYRLLDFGPNDST